MAEKRTTQVKFTITLDVDVDSWNLDYGTETVREVQADVRDYLRSLILGSSCGGLEHLEEHNG